MSYTQPPSLTREEIDIFLKETKISRICTFNGDGTIHATPIWFKYENGLIMHVTPEASRKARNLRLNKNVTILVDEVGSQTRGVIIYGKAELDYQDPISAGVSIFGKYMTEDNAKTSMEGLSKISKWVKITVNPERIASFDYVKDTVFRNAVTF